MHTLMKQGDRDGAQACWERISELTQLLFAEPSPAPAKYWLARHGLIDSAEVRLPMVEVSDALAVRLDTEIERRTPPLLRRARSALPLAGSRREEEDRISSSASDRS